MVKAQKGLTKTHQHTEWVSMQADPQQFNEGGDKVQTSQLQDSVGTVFDWSFEQYGSFEHLHFPQSFAISL